MDDRREQIEAICADAIPIQRESPSPHVLSRLIEHIKYRRIVMLGESSHGTDDFYSIRSALTEHLIKEHGYKFVAAEADWPTGEKVRSKNLETASRWPTWMWANSRISTLADSLERENAPFYGLDVYSLFESIDRVLELTRKKDAFLARRLEERYGCFDPFHRDEIAYAKSLLKHPAGCAEETLEALTDILRLRISSGELHPDGFFELEQNARIIVSAERFYRAMIHGDELSWNLRDIHMLDTLQRLLELHGTGSKCVVWAHNSHIGDYRATDMVTNGYVNLGGLAREMFGSREVALVGFGTHSGQVTAAAAWGGKETIMRLPPAQPDSIESVMHEAADKLGAAGLLLTFGDEERLGPLSRVRGHRAVGVVYQPEHESISNYVPTSLSNRYDAFIFIDQTRALESLHAVARRGEFPETYPIGA